MLDYQKYYPTESDFPTADIEQIIAKHDLLASDAILNLARACWAECNIHHDVQGEGKVYRVRLERTEIAEVFVEAESAEEAGKLAVRSTNADEFEYSGTQIISAEVYTYA
jgi:hypothetical protein